MPIEIKELVVRAWVDSQASVNKSEANKAAKTGTETSDFHAELLEQLRRMIKDKKDR